VQSVVGHVHLRVSDLQATQRFYTQDLGFDLMMHFGSQAGFVSAGGYHHHVGFNTWAGPFAPRSEQDCGGMGYYSIVLPDRYELERTATRLRSRGVSLVAAQDALSLRDPSGIQVRLETE
jgi:catechol 2,3-dioxygenase